jgi:transposase
MIVVGTDPHKVTHTCGAVDGSTGRVRGDLTAKARQAGFETLLRWARALDDERVWALEDVRGLSGRFERWLIARGERVVRVPPKLMAGARKSARTPGKSDPIDAVAVAHAALREGMETLPTAHLDGRALEIRLLGDHRDDLVAQRTRAINRLRWHLHDLDPSFELPKQALVNDIWQRRVHDRLKREPAIARVRIAHELLDETRELTRRIRMLERELGKLVAGYAPQLLAERGCGPLTAAKLVGEIAGVERFASDAKLARTAAAAPIPASSGNNTRHRLDPGGNRQLNCALHRWAVNRGRHDAETAAYLARKQAEGKTRKEALRCLKRYLARRAWQLLRDPATPSPITTIHCNLPVNAMALT